MKLFLILGLFTTLQQSSVFADPTPCTKTTVQKIAGAEPFMNSEQIKSMMATLSLHFYECEDPRYFFHKLYELTTSAVQQAIDDQRFLDPAWVQKLLIHYSNLYRDSLLTPSRSWEYSYAWGEKHSDADPQILLMTNLNVHLGFDMPRALAKSSTSVDDFKSHRADYQLINSILFAKTEEGFAMLEDRFGVNDPIRMKSFKKVFMQQWVKLRRTMAWKTGLKLEKSDFDAERIEKLDAQMIRRSKRIKNLSFIAH